MLKKIEKFIHSLLKTTIDGLTYDAIKKYATWFIISLAPVIPIDKPQQQQENGKFLVASVLKVEVVGQFNTRTISPWY